jgi:hypothetical protein
MRSAGLLIASGLQVLIDSHKYDYNVLVLISEFSDNIKISIPVADLISLRLVIRNPSTDILTVLHYITVDFNLAIEEEEL